MQKGLSLSQLAAKIEANRELKRDLVVKTRDLRMEAQSDGVLALAVPGQGSFPVEELAHDQIGTHLDIPAKYYDRMKKEEPKLLATNVNRWFEKRIETDKAGNPERRMVRTLAGNNRAFLSNRYQRIENEEVLAAGMQALSDQRDVQIVSAEATERRLYLQFVIPSIQGEVKVGDVVQAGGILSNSEVGLGAVSVAGLIWRLWCLNGAKTQDAFRKNHVGRQAAEGELDWADDTRAADDRAVLLKVRDMVKAVTDEARFKAQLAKLQELAAPKIEGDPAEAVEVLAQKVGANDVERGGILRALIEGGDLSAWGLINAVTAQSHTTKSYDRAVELEAAGGRLIELPASEWKEVLTAGA